jgi:hypothetical protein
MIQTLRLRTLAFFMLLSLLSVVPSMVAQNPVPPRNQDVPPRDQEKLLPRVREFWTHVIHGRKGEAVQFVSKDRQNDFLSGDPLPVMEAKVVGFDLTDSRERAAVRVSIKALAMPLAGEASVWTLTEEWVWRGNNWYANPAPKADLWAAMNGNLSNQEDVVRITKEIDAQLQGIPAEINLGRVVKGVQHAFEIPVQYSGERRLLLKLMPANPVFLVDRDIPKAGERPIRAYVDATTLEGPFAIPVKVRFSVGTSDVDKTVVVKGEIFRAITFRHTPAGFLLKGAMLSVFVRNNSAEVLPVDYIAGDVDGEHLKKPDAIAPGEEGEFVFKMVSDTQPTRLDILFKKSVFGSAQYTYVFPKTP